MNRPLDRPGAAAPVQIPLTGILQSSRRISIASPCSDTMALASDVDRYRRASSILDILRRLDHASLEEVLVIERAIVRLEHLRCATRAGSAEIGRPWSVLDEALRIELTDVRLEREHAAAVAEDAARDVERQIAGLVGTSVNTTAVDNPQMLAPADIVYGEVGEARPVDLSRLATARRNAGLKPAQASKLFGYNTSRIEVGLDAVSPAQVDDMAFAYGVTTEWLRGAHPVIAPETAAMLRDADISTGDRSSVTELLGSTGRGGEG